MENDLDKKIKDKQIPEEELFEELDAMYQRVADIEKEEATKVPSQGETALFAERSETPSGPEKQTKKEPGKKKRRDYRPIILAVTAVMLVFVLGMTFWKPMVILQLLKIGEAQQPMVSPPPRPRKPSRTVTAPAPTAISPKVPTPPALAAPQASPSAPPKSTPVDLKPEATQNLSKEAEKAKPTTQEISNPHRPISHEKYYAVQVGSFRNMENVRELAEILKKEGLDAYWISMKSHKGETLHRVFVGQFAGKDEAAQYLRDKKFLRNYPGSFVQEVSSNPP